MYQLAQRQTLVGRSRRCAIVLNSRLASREHCVLERSGAALTLILLVFVLTAIARLIARRFTVR